MRVHVKLSGLYESVSLLNRFAEHREIRSVTVPFRPILFTGENAYGERHVPNMGLQRVCKRKEAYMRNPSHYHGIGMTGGMLPWKRETVSL